ncbi:class I SAM-dependent methyltransferase [Pseudomonas sp. PDM14]|uniref:class I SAM-dependent methyltransferase n=1 Tax=Pseudomonas sp. PDM14 TaxID=2769288 RepID=UPI001781F38E|nr:methyltransferase domain-containing protein [Pseudomonas sp. PDM14]MBD9484802.1 class I SAM-dependent methyltransferase [Pseudomonas sp. PDM14]
MTPRPLPYLFAALFSVCAGQAAAAEPVDGSGDITDAQYNQVLAGDWRAPENRARDVYRHPMDTLRFFGLSPGQTLIEVSPGAGWYSEILAPLLRDKGQYIAAVNGAKGAESLRKKFHNDPRRYAKARIAEYDQTAPVLGEPNSADAVVTFRNVHNWVKTDTAPAMFKAMFEVLKPGGKLGVVEHRAAKDTALDAVKDTGYLPTEYVQKLATDAGFVFIEASEVNANPDDTKDYPEGVWTLPPELRLGDKDKQKYLDIGESDRMTLNFVKPAHDKPKP